MLAEYIFSESPEVVSFTMVFLEFIYFPSFFFLNQHLCETFLIFDFVEEKHDC